MVVKIVTLIFKMLNKTSFVSNNHIYSGAMQAMVRTDLIVVDMIYLELLAVISKQTNT